MTTRSGARTSTRVASSTPRRPSQVVVPAQDREQQREPGHQERGAHSRAHRGDRRAGPGRRRGRSRARRGWRRTGGRTASRGNQAKAPTAIAQGSAAEASTATADEDRAGPQHGVAGQHQGQVEPVAARSENAVDEGQHPERDQPARHRDGGRGGAPGCPHRASRHHEHHQERRGQREHQHDGKQAGAVRSPARRPRRCGSPPAAARRRRRRCRRRAPRARRTTRSRAAPEARATTTMVTQPSTPVTSVAAADQPIGTRSPVPCLGVTSGHPAGRVSTAV